MFYVVEIVEVIGIEPKDFGLALKDIAFKKLSSLYEGLVDEQLGYVISVLSVEVDEVSYMLPRDPNLYNRVKCKLLVYIPRVQEVVEGEVVELTDFGAFVRIGPLDALLHVSQILDDFVNFDKKNAVFVGSQTGWKLGVGDRVRARIVAVSLAGGKVGITTRQPYLGNLEWIEEQKRRERMPRAEKVPGR
ncbi:MAG: DNA-directed RNA polymerase [Nitrososphaerota archaeon]|nr:DNA-directed RNA polymerase [Candidatus Calditenuaceae archaeon]MDW8072737.1 DNA-directed RNA polymerase [Nitrososphaerota archaeon]